MSWALWDAERYLLGDKAINDCWCIGFAPSQGRRCHNRTNRYNRCEATSAFREIGSLDPKSRDARRKLPFLAGLLLCWRHGDQQDKIARQWSAIMNDLRLPSSSSGQERVQSSSTRSEISREHTRSHRNTRALETLTRQPLQLPTPQATPQSSSATTPVPSGTSYVESNLSELDDPTSALSESSTEAETASLTPTTASASLLSENPQGASSRLPISPREPQRPSTPPPAAFENLSTPHRPTTDICTGRHARRHALPAPCPICYDPMELGQRLSWCKEQCGQNFHRDCFEACHSTQCPYWYVPLAPSFFYRSLPPMLVRHSLKHINSRATWPERPCAHDDQPPTIGPLRIRHERNLNEISVAGESHLRYMKAFSLTILRNFRSSPRRRALPAACLRGHSIRCILPTRCIMIVIACGD